MALVLDLIVYVVLAIIAWADYRTMEIPDRWNVALALCGLASMFTESGLTIFDRLLGAFCVAVPMYLLICVIPGAFGGGDIKLTFAMGLYLGWKDMLTGTCLAILLGGIQAMCLLISGKARVGEYAHMAFGPALCLGFMIADLWGDKLLLWYFGLFY